ncbi:hypothetical protein P171DRAFT_472951 [Karstenula rhodostoma CBS 690.94]|uniref:Uncharacterized protein n=1 Tax=Karstenula rhodostoma CBS 690.94 TaxID=1392251 RepID=A0A9P4UD56_9PLEO|nr:hypothetical protein P171DRAFT_472951 [Karstenula rhodostoma CBS 690.94]
MEPQKEHQRAKKGTKQDFTRSTKNTKSTVATRTPTVSSSANGTKSASDHRFFTAPGLRIPLYDARGKRITHARDGRVIVHKISRERALDEYVRKYAGDDKVQEMEGKTHGAAKWSKDQIGDWITEVETRAFGQGPKGKTTKERKEEKRGENGVKMQEDGAGGRGEAPKGRVTRSMSEEMKMLLTMGEGIEDMPAPMPVSKSRPQDIGGATVANRGYIATTNGDANGKRKLPARESQETNKKPRLDRINAAAPSLSTAKAPASSPAQATSITRAPSNGKPDIATRMLPPNRKAATTSNPLTTQTTKALPPRKPRQPPPRPDTFPWNHADDDLYLAHVPDLHNLETHPFLSIFSLDPIFEPSPGQPSYTTPLRTLPLPSSRSHLLVSTTAHNRASPTIHAILLPHRDLENQRAAALADKKIPPPHRRRKNISKPFLKPGTHGWDYEKHAWGFEGDEDLETGLGHQVDPGDERALSEGEMSWEEFGKKYPGVRGGRGGMWPCGCVGVGEEGESEEE